LARYAGDEFVAIVPGLEGPQVDELRERIEAVVSAFALHVRAETHARVGISVGAAIFGVDGETLDHLLIAADQAMYRAKSAHKTGPARLATHQSGAPQAAAKGRTKIGPEALISTAIN